MLGDLPAEKRGACFVCTIAAVAPNGSRITVRGECRGRILTELHGKAGFGYDPLFFYDSLGKTFAELSQEEKNRVSHRAVAIKKFSTEFKHFLENNQ